MNPKYPVILLSFFLISAAIYQIPELFGESTDVIPSDKQIQVSNSVSSSLSSSTLTKMQQKFDSEFHDKTLQMLNAKAEGKLPEFLAQSRSLSSPSELSPDKLDSYGVVVVVSKYDNTERDPEIVSKENKENLASILRDVHSAKDIYVAEKLSFVSAQILVSELPKLAQYVQILKIGDGEKKLDFLSQDMAKQNQ